MGLEPAARIIKAFGGVTATAKAVGRTPGAVSRWQTPEEDGGTGGGIPRKMMKRVLEESEKRGLGIRREELV